MGWADERKAIIEELLRLPISRRFDDAALIDELELNEAERRRLMTESAPRKKERRGRIPSMLDLATDAQNTRWEWPMMWAWRHRTAARAIAAVAIVGVAVGIVMIGNLAINNAERAVSWVVGPPPPPAPPCDTALAMTAWDDCRFRSMPGYTWANYAAALGMKTDDLRAANPPLAALFPDKIRADQIILIRRP